MAMAGELLAIRGGHAISVSPWPRWPVGGPEALLNLKDVLDSAAWAISSKSNGKKLQCAWLREEFASYLGREWSVETDHGTSALVTAFEALGLGPGDEVIVPDLTWVACASSVMQVGATPVLVDVDPDSLCLSPATVEPALTARTRCILVVHLACTAADMPGLRELAARNSLLIVEDCAQAHGARWSDGRAVGSDGDLAVFSMQNGKTLSAGEGGAVVGDDDNLRRRVESARADTREFASRTPLQGEMYLEETGTLMGANYCMSEFAAALVRDGLRRLPDETRVRHDNAGALDRALGQLGLRTIRLNPELELRSVYEYGVFLEPAQFGDVPHATLLKALSLELNAPVGEMDAPIHSSRLFRPDTKPRFAFAAERMEQDDQAFPVADASHQALAMLPHAMLLAAPHRMDEIIAAFEKLIKGWPQLTGSAAEPRLEAAR